MTITRETATLEHARAIGPRLKVFGCAPELVRKEGVAMAIAHVRGSVEAWTWLDDGVPVAMAGVVLRSLVGGGAMPWLLTTPEAYRSPRTFWRASKALAAYLKTEYGRIEGHVDANFAASRRWVERLGFKVIDAPTQFEGMRVLPILMERES